VGYTLQTAIMETAEATALGQVRGIFSHLAGVQPQPTPPKRKAKKHSPYGRAFSPKSSPRRGAARTKPHSSDEGASSAPRDRLPDVRGHVDAKNGPSLATHRGYQQLEPLEDAMIQTGATFIGGHRQSMANFSPVGRAMEQRVPGFVGKTDETYGEFNHEAYGRLMGSPPTPVPLERDTHGDIKSKVGERVSDPTLTMTTNSSVYLTLPCLGTLARFTAV